MDRGAALDPPSVGVVILAGGEASRLPGKLSLPFGGAPLLVGAVRRLARGREALISVQSTFPAAIDEGLDAPLVVDRWRGRGPLAGLLSTLPLLRSTLVFVAAADAPLLEASLIERLLAAWDARTQAVVPLSGDGLEPLAALYDRGALLEAGWREFRSGRRSLRGVLATLRMRTLRFDAPRTFTNVNTPDDYAALTRSAT